MGKINKDALKNAALTAGYIALVGSFMFFSAQAKIGRANFILIPISLLMLFVCSAAITGYLIFGKPVQMYIDGKKKEALSLISHTLLYFAAITVVAVVLLVSFTR